MNDKVSNTIEQLYEAFSDIPKPSSIAYCSHCSNSNPYEDLITKPLHDLTMEDLEDYTHSVLYTSGSEDDFIYFLPRILELTTHDDKGFWIDREIIFKKIGLVKWYDWIEKRKVAFHNYIDAILQSFASVELEGYNLDTWISSFAECMNGFVKELDILLTNTKEAKHNLIGFYEWNHESLLKGKLGSSFLEMSNSNYKEILEWFQCERVTRRVNEIYNELYS